MRTVKAMSEGGYEIICENCRSPVSSDAPSCLHCGHPVLGPPPRPGEWVYFAGMESSANQGTLGKMVCGLAVTDTEGRRISFDRATGRYFAKILSALTLGIGYLMVGWTNQKRGLHDFIAGTLVVRR